MSKSIGHHTTSEDTAIQVADYTNELFSETQDELSDEKSGSTLYAALGLACFGAMLWMFDLAVGEFNQETSPSAQQIFYFILGLVCFGATFFFGRKA